MKNSELERYSTECMTTLQQQRRFCLRVARNPMKCPACHAAVSMIDVSGKDVDAYDLDNGEDSHHCPHCKRELVQVVPFMGSIRWELKSPLTSPV